MIPTALPGYKFNICTELFPTPVWHKILAGVCQGVLIRTIRKHGPNLSMIADGALKDDVAAVGRPAWEVVCACIVGELNPTLGCNVHHVDILAAGCTGAVFAVPGEG